MRGPGRLRSVGACTPKSLVTGRTPALADDHAKGPESASPEPAPETPRPDRFLFPRWTNLLGPASAVVAVGGVIYLTVLLTMAFHPRNSAIGYAPEQPVPYSHALHIGELGLDCRYCHTTVETSAQASLPAAEVCMNCHKTVHPDSPKLLPVRESYATGKAIGWIRVHDLADFAYFDHSAHVGAGVGCVSCHGRVDRMDVVSQQEKLTMSWCLDCHRAPEQHLRPREQVTVMDWIPDEDPTVLGRKLRDIHDINPSTDCTTCHR